MRDKDHGVQEKMRCRLWKSREEGFTGNQSALSAVLVKLPLIALLVLGLPIGAEAHAAKIKPAADIVYSARYYKPGAQRSHYKIWRTDPSGSRRLRVTSGKTEDRSPIWLADGKTILFVRERGNSRALCTVGERGGAVTELAALPPDYTFISSVAPNRRMIVHLAYKTLVLFDVTTRQERVLGAGDQAAWSPDSSMLYVTLWERSEHSAHILDLATGKRISLKGDLRAATFLKDGTLVAELFATDDKPARLAVLRLDGVRTREISLPFTWDDETDDLSPFADDLFAVPGDPDAILYGRHAGNSTAGSAQKFYRVNLKGREPIAVANGRDVAWSPDQKYFATGDGRNLGPLDRRKKVWVSPLSVVSLKDGKVRTIVRGLVHVGEFDWRP